MIEHALGRGDRDNIAVDLVVKRGRVIIEDWLASVDPMARKLDLSSQFHLRAIR